MFLSYEEMKKFEIIYRDGEGPKHALNDIHLNAETGEIISYIYVEEIHETTAGDTDYSNRSFSMVTAMGSGAAGNIGNMAQGEGLPYTESKEMQYYFIEAKNVSVEGDLIHYTGAIKEVDYTPREGTVSVEKLINNKAVTEEGKEVGKIKDVYLNIDAHTVEGLKLSEGFWQKVMGDGTKYLPASAIVKWTPEPVICRDPIEEYLVDEVGDMSK